MLRAVLLTLRQKNNLLAGVVYFILFSVIYYLLDVLNGGYAAMAASFGAALVAVNVAINVAMAAGTAFRQRSVWQQLQLDRGHDESRRRRGHRVGVALGRGTGGQQGTVGLTDQLRAASGDEGLCRDGLPTDG